MSSAVVVDEDVAFDALDTALEVVLGLDSHMLDTRARLTRLQRFEQVRRRLSAGEHPLINELAQEATPAELGGKLPHAIADWTLIRSAEAGRRVRDSADLGARHALTGGTAGTGVGRHRVLPAGRAAGS